MKWQIFYWRFLLVPVAFPLFRVATDVNIIQYRLLLVFGVRLAYWTQATP